MSTTTATTASTTPSAGPSAGPSTLVQAGTLADVTAAERLVQPFSPPGVSHDASRGLARLALAHLALTAGGLWVVRDASGGLRSAAALLPPGSHPDAAGLAWMAHVQLGVARPGAPLSTRPHVLLPPREGALAAELVAAALASDALAPDAVGSAPRHVVCALPSDPVVAAVLRDHGFTPDTRPGLLLRTS